MANKCWTCRRRRVKCDGCRPVCSKCAVFGRECLGYGQKPLIWAGMASRGKLSGKTFDHLEKDRKSISSAAADECQRAVRESGERGRFQQMFPASHFQESVNNFEISFLGNSESQVFRSLTDPGFVDLNMKSRRYIKYCKQFPQWPQV